MSYSEIEAGFAELRAANLKVEQAALKEQRLRFIVAIDELLTAVKEDPDWDSAEQGAYIQALADVRTLIRINFGEEVPA